MYNLLVKSVLWLVLWGGIGTAFAKWLVALYGV